MAVIDSLLSGEVALSSPGRDRPSGGLGFTPETAPTGPLHRNARSRVLGALGQFPVVLLAGARGVGKSTLARSLAAGDWPARYLSLQSRPHLDSALTDPVGFLLGAGKPLALSGVERAPNLLPALRQVQNPSEPGQYLLTTSSTLSLDLPTSSLGQWLHVEPLLPLSWSEWQGREPLPLIHHVFDSEEPAHLLSSLDLTSQPEDRSWFHRFLLSGGLPAPALMTTTEERHAWFEAHHKAWIEDDLRHLMRQFHRIPEFGRVTRALARRTGSLLNLSSVSREVSVSLSTVRRYFALLERTFQLARLRASTRLVSRPRFYFSDTGVACHLAGVRTWGELERRNLLAALIRTWVHGELRNLLVQSAGDDVGRERPQTCLYFWRRYRVEEVDFVLERGMHAVGLQVTASHSPGRREVRNFKRCREWAVSSGLEWRLGVVLHPGSEAWELDATTVALPLSVFFGVPPSTSDDPAASTPERTPIP